MAENCQAPKVIKRLVFLEKRINENSCSRSRFCWLSNAILLAQHNKVVIYDIVPAKVDLINSRKSPFVDKEIEAFYLKMISILFSHLKAR